MEGWWVASVGTTVLGTILSYSSKRGGEKMIDRWTDSSLYYFVHFVAASAVNGIATIFMFAGICTTWIL